MSKSKKKNKISDRLQRASVVFESFGHAKTIQNENSSRFGKYVEVQFNSKGKLAGAKISDYLLERKRVTNIPHGERGFHCFYQLLTGASTEQKTKWSLTDAKHFKYLSASKMYKAQGVDDVAAFASLKSALKAVGVKEKYQEQVFQVLAVILHLGNLEFVEGKSKEDAAEVKNQELLDIIAELLGVRSRDLENALVYQTKLIKKEVCTMFLDEEEAAENCKLLAQTLYSLLWNFLLDTMNKKLVDENFSNYVGLLDSFGLENGKTNYFNQLLYNYTAERLLAYLNKATFEREIELYRNENISFPEVSYGDNSQILDLLTGSSNGILTVFNEEAAKQRKRAKVSALLERFGEVHAENSFFIKILKQSKSYLFGVRHHSEDVYYDAKDFLDSNSETVNADFLVLFRGGPDTKPTKNSFVGHLFSENCLDVERAPKNEKTIVNALQVNMPSRAPSSKNSKKDKKDQERGDPTFAGDYIRELNNLFDSIDETAVSFVLCIRPNKNNAPNKFDKAIVQAQVTNLGLLDIVNMKKVGYELKYDFDTFVERYRVIMEGQLDDKASSKDKITEIMGQSGVYDQEAVTFGKSKVFVKSSMAAELDLVMRKADKAERKRLKEKVKGSGKDASSVVGDGSRVSSYLPDDQSDFLDSEAEGSQVSASEYTDDERFDGQSQVQSELSFITETQQYDSSGAPLAQKKGAEEIQPEEEEEEISTIRRHWLNVTFLLTWWIPNKCLEWNGMKRADIQQAWREKVALCILIILLSALMLFFIIGFSLVLCPRENMFRLSELAEHNYRLSLYVAVHGLVFDYTIQRNSHSISPEYIDQFGGKDATILFPRSASLCGLEETTPIEPNPAAEWRHDPAVTMAILTRRRNYFKGYLSFLPDEIAEASKKPDHRWVTINGNVYNVTEYLNTDQNFLGDGVKEVLLGFVGGDATEGFNKLRKDVRERALKCMNTIYFAGKIDTRAKPACLVANFILLAATGVLVAIMVVKFLSALRVGSKGDPEDHDRFVIIQVPCYTEGEENLRRTIDSLATLRYDDKRKLLMLIADGNIIGSGNDRATWRIALDILGVDPSIDPPKLSFQSLGEGNRQHNMGKVYTGLYDCQGHLVPYMVVVKVGKDNESRRPGNRGKRDTQLLLMRFLQKVHYDEPMSPLELEMFHQIKNVIGVDPSFYEFILMVDADTEVVQDSLNRLVSAMVHDSKIVGICGETTLANERDSLITMMQVYEYYISHHLAKAFESMFGSVTCLPGCFCMYRVRTPNKSIPLLISQPVITDYAENNVDTLHKKNLLSLGEDRYLTTLMLKHFPNMKISFTPDAICKTYAPDRWSILLSQRRRWINSTVHNLLELLLLPQLCGFCCFSMRFVVFFDLFSTLVMPATMGYLAYLIIEAINDKFFPLISLILLVAGYGLQIIIFLLKKKWEHIGWLIIYILALPFFTFFIPVYAFWHL